MKHAKIIPSKIAYSQRSKSFRASAAFILATLMLLIAAATLATAQTYTDLFNFRGLYGKEPFDILAQGRDGNLYGTTEGGGSSNLGVVFRITPSGKLKVLYNFDGVHGANPQGLTLGTDGNFYGTTYYGGADNFGTIFKITKSGSLTTLYTFTYNPDGAYPLAPLIQGTDGNFYGTTLLGGATTWNAGTVFRITPSGTLRTLHSFCNFSVCADGLLPTGGLVQATDGNFYGTTTGEGVGPGPRSGTVFTITPRGKLTTLYSFCSENDCATGQHPQAGLVQATDGNFYGTTYYGGADVQYGTAFTITPSGTLTTLYNFCSQSACPDGSNPQAGLVQATDGNFYGLTNYGGTGVCQDNKGCGVIFQITPAGAYTILYNFDGAHGAWPESASMQHTNGKIYGLTTDGGVFCCGHGCGVVYSLDMGLAPFVSLVSTTGKIGKTVEVLGQGFTGATAVSFNGTAATFAIKSDTYLTATVPTGATTGFVTVSTPTGTLTSNKQFRVKP